VDTAGEVDDLWAALSEGGEPLMEIGSYPWSERYGWVKDRYGASWQVIAGRRPPGGPTIAPCLMFSGAQGGRAREAMELYTKVFPGGRIDEVDRYAEGEGPAGWVKHGRFEVAGQTLVAMDSPVEHAFHFDQGLSLQVMCRD